MAPNCCLVSTSRCGARTGYPAGRGAIRFHQRLARRDRVVLARVVGAEDDIELEVAARDDVVFDPDGARREERQAGDGAGQRIRVRDQDRVFERDVADARRLGRDIGTSDILSEYERWRRFDNLVLAVVTDVMNRLFSNDIAPLRVARDLGLGAVNRIGPLRQNFMRHAMGTVGDLPRLVRGEAL